MRNKLTGSWEGSYRLLGNILSASLEGLYESDLLLREHALILSVLDQAVKDLTHGNNRIKEGSKRFFLSDEEEGEYMPFLWICEVMDIEPTSFRRELYRRGLLD